MGQGKTKLSNHIDELPERERYFGFTNFGQTCYMNSVLQALYGCVAFRTELLHRRDKEERDNLLACLTALFEQVAMNKKRLGVIRPERFFKRLRRDNPMFTPYQQQDAQEFLIFVLNRLSELLQEEKPGGLAEAAAGEGNQPPNKAPKTTWIQEMFEGRLRAETRCLCCETIRTREEAFLNLSVQCSQNTSITGCLRDFSKVEYLTKVEKYFCDTCCSYQEGSKVLKVHRQPKVLVVSLKRFQYLERLQCLVKMSARVPFPLELKLFNTTPEAGDQMYELQAVVAHLGNRANSGHYVAVVRSASYWLLYDDRTVQVVPETFLERLFGMTDAQKANSSWCDTAYILFYGAVRKADV